MKDKFQFFSNTAILASGLLLFSGCSTDSTHKYMNAIEAGSPIDTESLYANEIKNNDLSLEMYLMEKGRIALLSGNYKESMKAFKAEIELLKARELHDNTLPGTDINAGSIIVNDNLLPYKARLFELEMVLFYQSFNYLGLGDMEGALVEIRLADYLMREAEKVRNLENYNDADFMSSETAAHKKVFENQSSIESGKLASDYEIQNIPGSTIRPYSNDELIKRPGEGELYLAMEPPKDDTYEEQPSPPSQEDQNSDLNQIEQSYYQTLEEKKEILAMAKSSILNPYILYFSGLLYEMNSELDDAYISYKQALLLFPENPYFRQDTIRLAITTAKDYDIENFRNSYPEDYMQVFSSQSSETQGRLVVLYEDGWTPRKEEKLISLGAFAIAYPIYNFAWNEPERLSVMSETKKIGETYPACYMGAMALRALQEESKWRIIRQSARATVKGGAYGTGVTAAALGAASGNPYLMAAGLGAMLLAQAYNNLSENADLRCWMTLPENAQVMSKHIPAGEYQMTFSPANSSLTLSEKVPIQKGKTTIVWIVRIGQKMIYKCLWPVSKQST